MPTPEQAVHALLDPERRAAPADVALLTDGDKPGLYAWFVDERGARNLALGLGFPLEPGLIYAGQAGAGTSEATLGSRIRGNHLGGDVYASTFRLTLASILWTCLALEPIGERRMNADGEVRLTDWMRAHLKVSVVTYPDRLRLDQFETAVLDRLDPPLNLAKRPPTPIRRRLTELRRPFPRGAGASQGAPRRRATGQRRATGIVGSGPTPEELARELGLPNAEGIRAFLRLRFPRPATELWTRWGSLPPEIVKAVRSRFNER